MKKWLFLLLPFLASAQTDFKVLAFYTAQNDPAHVSFVHEANKWFTEIARTNRFSYKSTSDWSKLNADTLKNYQVILFLDTRPKTTEQRLTFENYVKNGGGFLGFHFSAFALDGSEYPNDWPWYNNDFLGCGQYAGNTWRPTRAVLKVEKPDHPAMAQIPSVFDSQPNEWYKWERDLRLNPDIDILLSIEARSFPLGTGPKPHEIWHDGFYPVFWSNKNFNMAYCNMGHNDMDYEGGTNATLSQTFGNVNQNRAVLNTLLWLGRKKS